MDRKAFQSSPHVIAFTNWLADRHRSLSIRLAIKSTRYVPGGIRADVTGLNAMLPCYRWRTRDGEEGNWSDTRSHLCSLGEALRAAIDAKRDDDVFKACSDILDWGGDRNSRVGARPYLTGLRDNAALADYLDRTRRAFVLDDVVIDESRPQASKMNSMLTKVHALASTDGLPIYDSRVAAAIAALVELWRRETDRTSRPLPAELAFPATTPARSVLYLFSDAQDPGLMSYAPGKVIETAGRWSSAKVRLGWLMREVLAKADQLFAAEEARGRMHAFEASLFMIGYDVGCLKGNRPQALLTDRHHDSLRRAGQARLASEQASLPRKTIATLSGKGSNLTYAGSVETGISGTWGKTDFGFHSEFLQDLLTAFPSGCELGLGASMTGAVKQDTLGFWIDEQYPSIPRRHVSALAAILVDQDLAERSVDGPGLRIRFL